MQRLGWGIISGGAIAAAIGLAGGCASSNSDSGTGGSGGAGTSATTTSTKAATSASTSTSVSTSVGTSSVASSSSTTTVSASSTTAMSSSSSGVMIPATWVCDPTAYADGFSCDCGCGAADPDCASTAIAACDICDDTGSCSPIGCPGAIDPTDNAKCVAATPENTDAACADMLDNDQDGDVDCADADCKGHAMCAPVAWTCNPAYYNSMDGCDCGCGVVDPDCASMTIATCDACSDTGSCSVGTCPGAIDPANIAGCLAPSPENTDAACADMIDNDNDGDTDCADVDCKGHGACPPVAWTCNPSYYGTADGCDCGCGVKDPDCPDLLVASCGACGETGSCSATSCPGTINPTNNATCM